MAIDLSKPQPGEYPAYAEMYYQLVSEESSPVAGLQNNAKSTIDLVRSLPENKRIVSWAANEWTVNEIFGHIMDQERVLVYRALRFARGDETELVTFDHENYVIYSRANERPLDEMINEFSSIRQASITFINSLGEPAWLRSGLVGGNRFSVRALVWLIVGHELHHDNSIKKNYF